MAVYEIIESTGVLTEYSERSRMSEENRRSNWSQMSDEDRRQAGARVQEVAHYVLCSSFNNLFETVYAGTNLFENKSLVCRPTRDHKANKDYFPFIPLSLDTIVEYLIAAADLTDRYGGRPRFLDVGCGLGNVMILAKHFFEVYGLEFSGDYVKAARKALKGIGIGPSNIIQCDALGYDGYGTFDVIYFYRPIRNSDKMLALEHRILTQAKIGAVIIGAGSAGYYGLKHGVKRYLVGGMHGQAYNCIYQKIAEPAKTDGQ